MVKAGYVYKGTHFATEVGTPQCSIISPLFANIYLNELDIFLRKLQSEFNYGVARRKNSFYRKILRERGINAVRKFNIPSRDPLDTNFKRLHFVRYADDLIVGISGSKLDAVVIKNRISAFLKENLKMDLKKDEILNFRKTESKFLGYTIRG
jgi:retron-type reverse transcriptase